MEIDPSFSLSDKLDSIKQESEAPIVLEIKEELTDDEFFQYSRQMGELYVDIIQSLIGQSEFDESRLDAVDTNVAVRIQKMKASIDTHREKQRLLVELRELTKEDILRPALSRLTEDQAQDILRSANYRIEETIPGMFIIYMDLHSMSKITSGQALAVKHTDIVSFILIRDLPDNPEFMATYLTENLPHEFHHIAWAFQRWDGIVKCTEDDKELELAYSMFQDEILAKMSSDSGLMGYSHLKVCSDEYRAELVAKDPIVIDEIKEKVNRLNNLLWDEIEPRIVETDVKRQDLIYATMEATNFDDLEKNLTRMKGIIEKQPKKVHQSNPDPMAGWGSVGV